METSKRPENGNPYIKMRRDVAGTFRALPVGRPVEFYCKEFAPYSSAVAAKSRLKDEGLAFDVASSDNGVHFVVTRLK